MRRRDPLKRAAIGGGVIVAAGVAWCLVMQMQVSQVKGSLQTLEDDRGKLEKGSKAVEENFKKIKDTEGKLDALQQLALQRTLWAPVLNSLQKVMGDLTPPGGPCPVTLLRFRVTQGYTYTEGKKPAAGAKGGGKPAVSTEKIVLSIEGRDYGSEQEQNYTKLKEKLEADPYLKEQFRKDNPVRLAGFSERQTDPADPTKSFVTFSLECNYPERARER